MDSIIELRHLKTLLALEETGSVSLAAKRVFLTQSALSLESSNTSPAVSFTLPLIWSNFPLMAYSLISC